jgi:hypothetical protein
MLNEAVRGMRKNGRQGQEIILGLIDEFDLKRNRWMLNDFVREQICRKTGHVAFINIHPPGKGDERNVHAHVLLMPRGLDEKGFIKEQLPALTPQDYDRIRDKWGEYGGRELRKVPGMEIEAERYRWGHLKLRQDPKDRRSWNGNNQYDKAKERGDQEWMAHCDRDPKRHLGPDGSAMDRESPTRKGDINRDIDAGLKAQQQDRYLGVHRKLPDEPEFQKRSEWERMLERFCQHQPNMPEPPSWVTGDGLQVWWVVQSSKTPKALQKSATERGLILARISQEDASTSHTRHWAAKREGAYSPLLKEGEYIIATEGGNVYRLHELSVGKTFAEVKQFMKPLDAAPIDNLRTVENRIEAARIAAIDPRPTGPDPTSLRGRINRMAERTAGMTLFFVGAGVVNTAAQLLGARPLTPEERVQRDTATTQHRNESEVAMQQQRRDDERKRHVERDR